MPELVERFPALRDDLDGLWIEGGARVDGRLLCAGLAAAVVRLGGSVQLGAVTVAADGPVRLDGMALPADAVCSPAARGPGR